jgi:hypothetical protein
MTESDWNSGTDPQKMLEFLRGKVSDRKLRLAACAACRCFWGAINQEPFKNAVEVGELYADSAVADSDRQAAFDRANEFIGLCAAACKACVLPNAFDAALTGLPAAASGCTPFRQLRLRPEIEQEEASRQTITLRDIFGNPFKPITMNSSWLTSTVVPLAKSIYDNRRFEDMPILADALEDSGCDNAEMLAHARSGKEHVRGCWFLDLLLQKE